MSSGESSDQGLSAGDWLARVKSEERSGEFLAAYDLARQALSQHPDDLELKHRAVLVLARSGATQQARTLFEKLELGGNLEEEIAALDARLAKDSALAVDGDERKALTSTAADRYQAIFERTGGYYPGINAATMRLLSGHDDEARDLARAVRGSCAKTTGEDTGDAYYRAATMAEASLLLDKPGDAQAALEEAMAHYGGDLAAVAANRKQLRRICLHKGIDQTVLATLKSPTVIVYCGHMISAAGKPGRFPASAQQAVGDRIAAYLDERDIGYGYGSLACGADILIAEALLSRRAQLNVVLPFEQDEFKEISVAPGGPSWLERFDLCLGKAASVSFATDESYLGDDQLFGYAGRLVMGLALLRAAYLDTDVEQLTVWDRVETGTVAGTSADIAVWRSRDLPTHVIDSQSTAETPNPENPRSDAESSSHRRTVKAFLFGDVRGFSKLRDAQLPAFVEGVLGGLARVLERYDAEIQKSNTWGDGLFIVMNKARQAANCALDMQREMARLDLPGLGLPSRIALRLGGHAGPVFELKDPVLKTMNYFGSHVSRTARIEPVTPGGQVYVTKFFASETALAGDPNLGCEYVGHMPAAKDYGSFRMYVLKRRPGSV